MPHAADILSPRQRAVLTHYLQEMTDKEIAAVLGIALKTVSFYRTEIRKRFGVQSNVGLVRFCVQNGLLAELLEREHDGRGEV